MPNARDRVKKRAEKHAEQFQLQLTEECRLFGVFVQDFVMLVWSVP